MNEFETNILYLTTRCNLDCEYCYEKKSRDSEGFVHKEMSGKDLDEYFSSIKGKRRCVVMFGGEPFLKSGLILRAINKYSSPNISLCITTNGLLLSGEKLFERFVKACARSKGIVKLEISYDESGNSRRKLLGSDKDSSSYVHKLLSRINILPNKKFKTVIKYTLHKLNESVFHLDIVNIFKKYPFIDSLEISMNFNELTNLENIKKRMLVVKDVFKEKFCCKYICDYCGLCEYNSKFKYSIFGNLTEKDNLHTEFNHWDDFR